MASEPVAAVCPPSSSRRRFSLFRTLARLVTQRRAGDPHQFPVGTWLPIGHDRKCRRQNRRKVLNWGFMVQLTGLEPAT
jgi:hypothetical protein